jgi:hypothetical protein
MNNIEFTPFPKMARLSREIIITEKIDGTNGQILITEDGEIKAGSRNRWITIKDDNYGFAKWVLENKEELLKLGVGRHYGEWWGKGIQRGYNIQEKRFSLFNTQRWEGKELPKCVSLVPVIHKGNFSSSAISLILNDLEKHGSIAAPGFMNPEGIVIYHTAANICFKKTIKDDEVPKSKII